MSIVLLPLATPHTYFTKGGVFHAYCLPQQFNRKAKDLNQTTDYIGYSAVKFASKLSDQIVATIPPKTTVVGLMLDQLLDGFVDTNNILSQVERLEVDTDSIVSQVRATFAANSHEDKIVLIWPYQIFNAETPLASGDGGFVLGYTHPNASINKPNVPEAICFDVAEATDESGEVVVKTVMKFSEVDEMLRGNFTRFLSLVEIERDDFNVFEATAADKEDIFELIKKSITGKRAVLVNPQGNQFI